MNTAIFTAIPFLMALIMSLILTPITIWVFTKNGWVVDPKKNPHPAHIHKTPIPKGGGIPILVATMTTVFLLLKPDSHLIAILLAGLITVAVGVVDDVRGVNPYVRLGTNMLSGLIIVASGIGIAFVSNPLGGIIDLSWPRITMELFGGTHQIWLWADLFALLWIPSLMNAINWSSGVDGQISGVVSIAALTLGLISMNFSADITQWPVSTLAFALSGAFLGFTVFHFYPQKVMPGYSATSLAGLILGVISILATAKVGALIVVLGVPLIDFVYLIVKRIASHKSPVWGDKDHLHHKLLSMGWSKSQVAMFYWGMSSVLGYLAVSVSARAKLMTVIGLVLLMVFFLLWQYFGHSPKQSDQNSG